MTLLPDSNDAAMLEGLSQSDTPTPDGPMFDEGELQFPEPTQPDAPAPEEGQPSAPPPAAPQPAPANDWQQDLARFARLQTERLERDMQPAPQAPQPAPAWVDPYERPENVQRMDSLLERMSYDADARREYMSLQRSMDDERMRHTLDARFGDVQNEMRLTSAAPQVQRAAFEEQRAQYGDNLRQSHWDAVVNDVFGGNPVAVAQALDPRVNPQAAQTRQMLADAAVGRALRGGELAPAARPPAPPVVRSDARNPAPSRAPNGVWQDNAYVSDIISQAFENPFKFVKKGGQS